jgi:hypothetical protein
VSGEPLRTDLVLHSYARQLERVVKAAGRVYDLGGLGLPTGAPSLRTPAELDAVLKSPVSGPGPAPLSFRPSRAAVDAFLHAERERLRLAEQALASAIAAARRGQGPGASGVREAVREVEYVRLPVPEADPERLAAPGNLALAAVEARSLGSLLDRLLA